MPHHRRGTTSLPSGDITLLFSAKAPADATTRSNAVIEFLNELFMLCYIDISSKRLI